MDSPISIETGSRKPILVVYHGQCTDGFTAAWAAWKKFGETAEYVAAKHPAPDSLDVDGREVYLLDYCPARDLLLEYAAKAKSIRVLDHHKTSEAACSGLDFCTFDMNRSGAGIAWDFFHLGVERPGLIHYVEDRDIWRWALPSSRTVSAAILSYDIGDFEVWSRLAERIDYDLPSIIMMGNALERAANNAIDLCSKNTVSQSFAGYDNVPVVNAVGVDLSTLLNRLSPDNGFAIGWYQRSDGTFKYSVRSRGDFDCAQFAEHFGGGGHKGAAAFVSSLPPWELKHMVPLSLRQK